MLSQKSPLCLRMARLSSEICRQSAIRGKRGEEERQHHYGQNGREEAESREHGARSGKRRWSVASGDQNVQRRTPKAKAGTDRIVGDRIMSERKVAGPLRTKTTGEEAEKRCWVAVGRCSGARAKQNSQHRTFSTQRSGGGSKERGARRRKRGAEGR